MNGEWFPGHHEPLITPEMFSAAARGGIKGRAKGKDLLSGKVRCGMCQRLMALDQNGEGREMYRCKHRRPAGVRCDRLDSQRLPGRVRRGGGPQPRSSSS
jgi:hypothetical protein